MVCRFRYNWNVGFFTRRGVFLKPYWPEIRNAVVWGLQALCHVCRKRALLRRPETETVILLVRHWLAKSLAVSWRRGLKCRPLLGHETFHQAGRSLPESFLPRPIFFIQSDDFGDHKAVRDRATWILRRCKSESRSCLHVIGKWMLFYARLGVQVSATPATFWHARLGVEGIHE